MKDINTQPGQGNGGWLKVDKLRKFLAAKNKFMKLNKCEIFKGQGLTKLQQIVEENLSFISSC